MSSSGTKFGNSSENTKRRRRHKAAVPLPSVTEEDNGKVDGLHEGERMYDFPRMIVIIECRKRKKTKNRPGHHCPERLRMTFYLRIQPVFNHSLSPVRLPSHLPEVNNRLIKRRALPGSILRRGEETARVDASL